MRFNITLPGERSQPEQLDVSKLANGKHYWRLITAVTAMTECRADNLGWMASMSIGKC